MYIAVYHTYHTFWVTPSKYNVNDAITCTEKSSQTMHDAYTENITVQTDVSLHVE